MIAAGRNTFDYLFTKSNKQADDGTSLIDPPEFINLDYNQIVAFSMGSKHSVYITKDGKAFGYGDDRSFFIGTPNRQIYQNQVQIIFDNVADKFISVKCGQIYTAYLTEKGFMIICSEKSVHFVPSIHTFKYPIVYISGSYLSPVAIDAKGDFYIFSKNPAKAPRHFHLQEPVYDICRCSVYVPVANKNGSILIPNQPNFPNTHSIRSHLPPIKSQVNTHPDEKSNCCKLKISFTVVVTVNGKLYANGALNNNSPNFSEIYSMYGVHVKHVYGYCGHCIAISDNGHVYSVGDNSSGQLGDGTTIDKYQFVPLHNMNNALSNEIAVDASVGDSHSLIITESGKLFGFGANGKNQLFTIQQNDNILVPTEINLESFKKSFAEKNKQLMPFNSSKSEYDGKITFAWCSNSSSIALIGQKPPIHLGFSHFLGANEGLAMQIRSIGASNSEHMEKQIDQLKLEIQHEKDQNQLLLQEKQKLLEENQRIKNEQEKIRTQNITFNNIQNERNRRRMQMKLCDIFDENDNLTADNERKTKEIEELKKENDKLRYENEKLRNDNQHHISKEEYNKELNFKNNENIKLKKELEEKNVKIANLLNIIGNPNDKTIIKITEPILPRTNVIQSRHVNSHASSAKAMPIIKKPSLPSKK